MNGLKKITLGLLLSFQTLTIFYACDNPTDLIDDTQNSHGVEYNTSARSTVSYQEIGRLHNAGLEFIYSRLSNNNKLVSLSYYDILEQLKRDTYSYTKSVSFTSHVSYEDYFSIFVKYDKVSNSQLQDIKNFKYDFNIIDALDKSVSLSSNQIKYLSKLDVIISNYSPNNNDTFVQISNLEREIHNNCEESEKFILLSSTSIAVNSLEYWNKNLNKWMLLANNNKFGNTTHKRGNGNGNGDDEWEWFKGTIKSMGKSDVVGGLIGAGAGALAGGVGAAPGAVGGACYSSAGRGIVALTEKWGLW